MRDRTLAAVTQAPHGRTMMGGEPLVFHCNFYNYFLQKTLLLDESLGMEAVIRDAGASSAYALLTTAAARVHADTPEARRALASDTFSELGFGRITLDEVRADGGLARVPVSHYGTCLRAAAGAPFARPQSYFDAGYAASAAAVIHGLPGDALVGQLEACQSMGAPVGRVRLRRRETPLFRSPGQGAHREDATVPPPFADTRVDEAGVLASLATLNFSGNEEGLIPRFGVMLTRHFANFYNRVSFEFLRRMAGSGLEEAAESLLVEAGYRCAFHTFGGIMVSPEWDAVVRPQCERWEDWVCGIVAIVNAFGWGVWRVHALAPDRLVLRIWDDYESCGYVGMYGRAARPVSFLATGGAVGIMNLIRVGDIHEQPELDRDFYVRIFESADAFRATTTRSMARGDEFTEIVVER